MNGYDAEELILQMADMVMENRRLKAENRKLYKMVEEYHNATYQRMKESEAASANMLKAALVMYIGK